MSHVRDFLYRGFVNFVILGGLPFAPIGGRLTVGHLIMRLLKYWRESNMIIRSICGVLVCSLISYLWEKLHFIISVENKP